MATLFEISKTITELESQLDDLADQPQEQQTVIEAWLKELEAETREERDRKLDNYAALIGELQARAEARKQEADRLLQRAKTDQNKAENLKRMLQWFFEAHDLKKVETARYQLALTKHGGKPPLEIKPDLCPEDLPPQFQRVKVEVDTAAIRTALEAGEMLDFARLGERGQSIRIK
jgi:hypothetical protein